MSTLRTNPGNKSPFTFPALFVVALLLLLISAGCGAAEQATSTPVPTPTAAIPTSLPVVTLPPATATGVPTSVPQVTETPTKAAATGTPNPQAGQWQQVGIPGKVVQNLAQASSGLSSVLATGPGGAWRAAPDDDYTNWTALSVSLSGQVTTAAVGNASIMYAIGHTGCLSGAPITLHRTMDGGTTWQDMTVTDPPLSLAAIDEAAYGITCRGIAKTIDAGVTWTALPGSNLTNYDPHVFTASPDGKSISAGYVSEGGTSRVMRSTDSGVTWAEITPVTPPNSPLTAIAALVYELGSGSGGLYMTSDQGLWHLPPGSSNWQLVQNINPTLENPERITALYVGAQSASSNPAAVYEARATLVAGGLTGEGVFRSLDGGATWEPFGTGLDQRVVNNLLFAPSNHSTTNPGVGKLLAATNDGIFAITSPGK